MHLEIITLEKVLFKGEVDSVKLPGSKGSFEALNNHAAIISTLEKGNVVIRNGSDKTNFPVQGGIAEILKNKIIVLA
ncbi:MAG: F0F1 ATP synthase subunit epsilon [Bacteroidota bacterium]|nr:F0F1 ATP synthase subunit epsilon [Bacteroidota bacterium]